MNRKVTYRLYPTPSQERRLYEILRLHQQLYNAALEQRIEAWRLQRKFVTYVEQCRQLTDLRAAAREYSELNAQSEQVTLKRLDLAFRRFFRRMRAGRRPFGYPRFKSTARFPGWGYTTHGVGWRLHAGGGLRHGKLRLSGVGLLRIRGRARNIGEPKTLDIQHKAGRWYATVTIECSPVRSHGDEKIGVDWGVGNFATLALEDGRFETIENPRFFRQGAAKLISAQRALAKKKRGSRKRENARRRFAALHRKIANRRRNFLHQQSAKLVARASLIATESLRVRDLTRSARGTVENPGRNVKQKAALNQSILDTAPARFLQMLRTKAEEAACEFVEVPHRVVKPSQACSGCGELVPKMLSHRKHHCVTCGLVLDRDENAGRICLSWALHAPRAENRPAVEEALCLR
jgi:putative transposase